MHDAVEKQLIDCLALLLLASTQLDALFELCIVIPCYHGLLFDVVIPLNLLVSLSCHVFGHLLRMGEIFGCF